MSIRQAGTPWNSEASCTAGGMYRKLIMADEDRARDGSAQAPKTGGSRKSKPEDRPFDMWLQKQLHAMYDEIASEPLPDDLLGLISGDAAASRIAGNDQPGGSTKKKN